jgi:hypothetical protein
MSVAVNENVIEFKRNQETATVTFCQGRYVSKIKKLAEQYPDECEIVAENPDGSIMAHIPTKWVKISRVVREMTDEQRAEQAERMRSNLANMKSNSKTADNALEDN